jgi:DNA-directed RNA polymerase specialized sigma subunit
LSEEEYQKTLAMGRTDEEINIKEEFESDDDDSDLELESTKR